MSRLISNREEARVLGLLGTLLTSGIPLVKALGLTAKTFPAFKFPLDIIEKRLNADEGTELFTGLEGYFSDFVPPAIKYGCMGGVMEIAFSKASRMLLSTEKLLASGIPAVRVNEVNYYRLLGLLLGGGCPLLTAMKIVGYQCLSSDEIRTSIMKPIREGEMLTDGLKEHPELFSSVGCSFMNIGEQIGAVPEVCESFADLLEKQLLLLASLSDCDEATKTARTEEMIEYGHLLFLLDINSGFDMPTMERILTIVSESATGQARKAVYKTLADKVKTGQTLGVAMESMPDQFSPYVATMINQARNRDELAKVLRHVVDSIS